MTKQIYIVSVKFTFKGEFHIKADNLKQAEEYAEKHCGLVLPSNGIHSSLPDDEVDWEFPVHPEKMIG